LSSRAKFWDFTPKFWDFTPKAADFPKMDIDGHGPIEQQGRRRVRCLATIELSDI